MLHYWCFLLFGTFASVQSSVLLIPKLAGRFVLESALMQDIKLLANFSGVEVYFSDNSKQDYGFLHDTFDIEEDASFSVPRPNVSSLAWSQAWHLGRVSHRENGVQDWVYNQNGSCHVRSSLDIRSYVIDTGIDIYHREFGGRAEWGANFADNNNEDCHGHGTHVAGLIGSQSYGVCVDAKLVAVKVLDCEGSGRLSSVIKGMEWVYKQHQQAQQESNKVKRKSVINMSLGGGYSSTINKVVETISTTAPDLYVVVAAGNENQDACQTSPASSEYAFTIMASDMYDSRARFSNWGSCAYIYAPGVDILSLAPKQSTAVMSGTSMASPVFAGVLNHYIDMYPSKNNTVMKRFVSKRSTKNVIHGDKQETVNRLVYFARD
jgi:cerevisin